MSVVARSVAPFTRLSKIARVLLLPFVAMVLAACDPASLPGLPAGSVLSNSRDIQVALLVPRGSGSGSDDLIARNLENAAKLAAADLNGVEIDLRVYPTAGNAETAAAAASRAVAEGAQIILGPLYGASANAAGVAVAGSGVNVLSFSNNTTIAGGNVFVLGNTFDNTAQRLVSYARTQGKSNILVVSEDTLAGQVGRNAISSAIAQSGARLAGSVSYARSQEDVIAAVPRISSAVSSSGADAIFFTAEPLGALPLLSQLLIDNGVSSATSQFIGLTRWDGTSSTRDLPGVQNGWFALPDPNRSEAFRQRYQAAYGDRPHDLASLAFDGIAVVGALAARGRGFSSAALTQGAGYQGAGGVFRLLPNGGNQRGLAVATIRNRQILVIDPAPTSFSGFGF